MTNLFAYVIIVLVLLVLALYAVTLLPFAGGFAIIRPLLMFLCVVIAGYAIWKRARPL